jgi:ribose 5-phosphate isomerase RpiB
MKVAIITEASTADRNADVAAAMEGSEHEVINVGMKSSKEEHKLNYVQTGFLSGLFLNAKQADLILGGCGTGHGYTIAAHAFPNVHCVLVETPLQLWISAQINAPNCLSFPLNRGYGWGGDVNLRFMLEKFFSVEPGSGYPSHRREAQKGARSADSNVRAQHLSMPKHRPWTKARRGYNVLSVEL